MRTSFHHQPEAQHPKSPAIYTPADYPIFGVRTEVAALLEAPYWPCPSAQRSCEQNAPLAGGPELGGGKLWVHPRAVERTARLDATHNHRRSDLPRTCSSFGPFWSDRSSMDEIVP